MHKPVQAAAIVELEYKQESNNLVDCHYRSANQGGIILGILVRSRHKSVCWPREELL